jgi:hypothetical protein
LNDLNFVDNLWFDYRFIKMSLVRLIIVLVLDIRIFWYCYYFLWIFIIVILFRINVIRFIFIVYGLIGTCWIMRLVSRIISFLNLFIGLFLLVFGFICVMIRWIMLMWIKILERVFICLFMYVHIQEFVSWIFN